MTIGELGRVYDDGEIIMREGEKGDCMYVIQTGAVEVLAEGSQGKVRLTVLEDGEVFGEMALFSNEPRSATVRVLGGARILTVDRKGFLRRVHEDPSVAFRILEKMSIRIRNVNAKLLARG